MTAHPPIVPARWGRLPPGARRRRSEIVALLVTLRQLPRALRREVLAGLPAWVSRALSEEWWWQARGGQIEPPGDWRIWAIVAGRGFGKTRAGSEWVWQRARETPDARIALVAASKDEAERVMVRGPAGILACARTGEAPRWIAGKGLLLFPSGAQASVFGADPDRLRGPQHHFAWCDELAKWPKAGAAWDNLMLGLRLDPGSGGIPRALVTTTPRPVPALKRILAMKRCELTQGRTDDNPDCAADFRSAMRELYAGTRLERQELDGLLLDDLPGALWTREILDRHRRMEGVPRDRLVRVVIGVDPPITEEGRCGIVACGLDDDRIAHVLADHSVAGLRPEGWAQVVVAAVEVWQAQRVAAEGNQGGQMVLSVLRAADSDVPVELNHAGPSKAARAEPVALRFETGQARLAGSFPALEAEMCAMTYGGYEGEGRSPDRADAMVWAMTELFKKRPAPPRIRTL